VAPPALTDSEDHEATCHNVEELAHGSDDEDFETSIINHCSFDKNCSLTKMGSFWLENCLVKSLTDTRDDRNDDESCEG
jgi:hypothetical protein